MNAVGNWIVGGIVGIVGIVGLFLASRASDGTIYWTGLALFAFAVLFVFGLIGRVGRPQGPDSTVIEEGERPAVDERPKVQRKKQG